MALVSPTVEADLLKAKDSTCFLVASSLLNTKLEIEITLNII